MFLPQMVRVSCIFCVEIFLGLSYRPLETRIGLLYLPPPLMYGVPQYMLNSSKFPKDSTVHYQNSPFTLQGTATTPPQMLLVTPEPLYVPQVTYLGEHHQISRKITNLGKSPEWVTCHKTLHHHVEIPLPTGICSELIRHFKQGDTFTISLAQS